MTTSDRASGSRPSEVVPKRKLALVNTSELLARWRKVANLMSESAFAQVWTRNLADCAQLLDYAPLACGWIDVGSGAGFAGWVIAILLAEKQDGMEVHCLESARSERREDACSYGRRSRARAGAPARIYAARIEIFDPCALPLVDAVPSRALAPLPRPVELANVWLMRGAVGIILRGRLTAASTESFSAAPPFEFKSFRNNFDPDARIDCVHSRHSSARGPN